MFESDQFHQFIGSSRTVLSPLSNFPLHGFDSYISSSSSSSLHMTTSQLHHQDSSIKNIDDDGKLVSSSAVDDEVRERRSTMDPIWSNDEVLALLKIRSSLEIWFPDFTWEHVSRKLVELGFKRSPDQCRQKFEEESRRHFNNNNNNENVISYNSNKHYRPIFSDLDEIYPTQHHHQQQQDAPREDMEKDKKMCTDNSAELEENPSQEINDDQDQVEVVMKKPSSDDNKKNRKRKAPSSDNSNDKKKKNNNKFEKFKGFCEAVVAEMVARQEELHRRLIEGIVKSDEESIAREEEWKNQERERMRREMEMREKEQADAEERQAVIVEFLKKFMTTSDDHDITHHHDPELSVTKNKTTTTITELNNPSPTNDSLISQIISTNTPVQKTASRSPSPSSEKHSKPNMGSSTEHELRASTAGGKRWPREEVLALINLRCKLMSSTTMQDCNNISNDSGTKEGGGWRGPLWERISRGMSEMGYDRNAKRCKEKWENINKYFRKTRDGEGKRKTKRSVDSRTCPYFQQLSCLYSGGAVLPAPENEPENP